MVEEKDVHSLPLVRAPESQLTAKQSSTRRHWNSPKKIPHIQREKRSEVKVLSPTLGFPTWGSSNRRRNSQRIRL